MKILVVDEQPLIRKGLISVLALQDSMEVVGEAGNKQEALHFMQKERPDLVIVDFQLGKGCGLDVIHEARQLSNTCKFALLTSSKDPLSFERAKELDIEGYISREASAEELIYAFQLIQRGRKYYDPDIIDLLMQPQLRPRKVDSRVELLTSKEKEVLERIGIGFSNKQIAQTLFITENTVKKHVSQVLAKLDLGDRTQAALYANETGLVQYSFEVPV